MSHSIINNYEQGTKPYKSNFKANKKHGFYLNSDYILSGSADGWRIDLYNSQGAQDTDISEIIENRLSGGFRWKSQLKFNNYGNGAHYLAITDNFGGDMRSFADASKTYTFTQDTSMRGCEISPDGKKFFINGSANDTVYQYSLSTAFDISTASYDSVSLASGQQQDHIEFSRDGTKLFIVDGTVNITVYEYTLPTPWRLSGAFPSATLDLSDILGSSISCITFSLDGEYMFIMGGNLGVENLFRLSLTNYSIGDITTATAIVYEGDDYASEDINCMKWISPNRLSMYDDTGDVFNVYECAESYDIQKLKKIYSIDPSSIITVSGIIQSYCFSKDHTNIYILDNAGTDRVRQATLSEGKAKGYDITTETLGTPFSVASQATLGISIEFSAFGDKMYILNYTGGTIYQYSLSTAFQVSTASYDSVSFSLGSDSYCIRLSKNGRKLFAVLDNGGTINQYNLIIPWDLSSIDPDIIASKSITSVRNIDFTKNGKIMYMNNVGDAEINKYVLSSPYDIETAVLSQTISVAAASSDVRISKDGLMLWTLDANADSILEHTLSVAHDLNTLAQTASQSFAISTGFAFNNDGTKLFIIGFADDEVNEYSLTRTHTPQVIAVSTLFNIFSTNDHEYIQLCFSASDSELKLESGYENEIFIEGNITGIEEKGETEQYRGIVQGRTRNLGSTSDEVVTLEIYKADQETHEALAKIFILNVEINGRPYIKEGSYEVSFNRKSKTHFGTQKLIKQEEGALNVFS